MQNSLPAGSARTIHGIGPPPGLRAAGRRRRGVVLARFTAAEDTGPAPLPTCGSTGSRAWIGSLANTAARESRRHRVDLVERAGHLKPMLVDFAMSPRFDRELSASIARNFPDGVTDESVFSMVLATPTPHPNRYEGSPPAIRPRPARSSPNSSSANAASAGTPTGNSCYASTNPVISTGHGCPEPSRFPNACPAHSAHPLRIVPDHTRPPLAASDHPLTSWP
jgi:hypothetical protein